MPVCPEPPSLPCALSTSSATNTSRTMPTHAISHVFLPAERRLRASTCLSILSPHNGLRQLSRSPNRTASSSRRVPRVHPTAITTHPKNGLEGKTFPSVCRVVVPGQAHNLLRCCPNPLVVLSYGIDTGKLIAPMEKMCEHVEEVDSTLWSGEKELKRELCTFLTNNPD